jgi:hypothetical protein
MDFDLFIYGKEIEAYNNKSKQKSSSYEGAFFL